MKKILGLDLGTNSIGCAVINDETNQIEIAGSRIIPMDAAILGDFDKGNSVSQTAQRTQFRGVRRLRERHLLRRERLHRALNVIGFLPEHYANEIDFEKRLGQIIPEKEPKLAWREIAPKEFEFIFKPSFEEMLSDFRVHQPAIFRSKNNGTQTLIPYDWTIYYLRKKALTQQITGQELAWILLNFNQKRGYYQLRGEDEEEVSDNKTIEFHALKVVGVEATDDKKGKETRYNVHLENGWIYCRTSTEPLDWVGKTKEFIVTTEIKKDGEVKRSFRAPGENDWMLVKKRTESEIIRSGKTVGEFIYDTLLQNPNQKIKGRLVRVVERKFYKDELIIILARQREFHPELSDKTVLNRCLDELYKNNESHRKNLESKDVCHLLLNDIIFYQRPLKSKKSLIADCQYEENRYVDNGEVKSLPLKAIPKSNPLFQEYRLWQFVSNLKVFRKGDTDKDEDVTQAFIKDYSDIYRWLNDKKEIDQKGFLSRKEFGLKRTEIESYRWNYVDKAYPCNETRALMLSRLAKYKIPADFLNDAGVEYALWHILYSVTDRSEIESALGRFARRHNLDAELFVDAFKRCKPFANDYGSYSEKAIKKLLSVMRMGEYWSEDGINSSVRSRIEKIISGEFDEAIDERTREKCLELKEVNNFSGLPVWLACYVVYGRHSEAKEVDKWTKPEDIDAYLRKFKQHSLRNPIVEQIVTETLRTVRDVWKQAGQIDEIHIELGREMKNPASVRKEMSETIAKNENTNIRIKMLLQEFLNPEYNIDGVRPYSPSQQDILRIYEDEILKGNDQIPEDVELIIKKFRETEARKQPSKSEIMRYKLWLEQQYRSPYTGAVIPLGRLFTSDYEIEHIIPQSRFFDDSLTNKVICEAEVNKLKDNRLGLEFINKHHGEKVTLSRGHVVTIYEVEAYEEYVKSRYKNNRGKLKKLLLTDIPEGFNQRQLNDTRYISRFIMGLLSNIVRQEEEIDAISKNVIACTGGVTDCLKREWGLNDVWNDIVYPRFERMNSLTDSQNFGYWSDKDGKRVFQTQIPLELAKGFNKKRIDHRHHAMDAIVIACATRSHVNYLNNDNGKSSTRHDLKHKLCYKTKPDANGNYKWQFHKPWDTFTQDARTALQGIIVGFKQNLRVINKATNKTLHYNDEGKKVLQEQKGVNWAIRKSMHKDTVFGQVNLRGKRVARVSEAIENHTMIVDSAIKNDVKRMLNEGLDSKKIAKKLKDKEISKIEIYYFSDNTSTKFGATRKSIDVSFDAKKIDSVTDTCIRKILFAHLENCDSNPELAFSPDGIAKMNEDIRTLNGGKEHQPIYKARVYEPLGSKFAVGTTGNKSAKFVEADKGTNLFFAIYADEDGRRNYDSIPLNVVIERQKQGLKSCPESNEKGDTLLYTLSPNDLVYLPTADQIGRGLSVEELDKERIYKMVSCTGNQCFFISHSVSSVIVNKLEFTASNKMERAITGEMIKEGCIPIKVDRIGNIIKL